MTAVALTTTSALFGCSGGGPQTPVQRGRDVYMTNCVVCHNSDPNLPGLLGPAIAGSSRALIRDRILYLSYPPFYKPQKLARSSGTTRKAATPRFSQDQVIDNDLIREKSSRLGKKILDAPSS